MIQAIKASTQTTNALKPYILVEIGTKRDTELALIDTGADINAISYETWEILGKPRLNTSTINPDTISGPTISVEGSFKLEVFIGTTDVHAEFYVMKPGTMVAPVILGQLWQRQYNGVPNWQEDGLNFKKET